MTHGAPDSLSDTSTMKNTNKKNTANSSDCLDILCTYKLWVRVGPPDYHPKDLTSESFDAAMEKQPKALPFVVLIHGPKVVYPCCVECTTVKTISNSCRYLFRFCKLKILSYDFPIFLSCESLKNGVNCSAYLETRISKLFRSKVRSSSAPAFGYITLRSAIGRAMLSNVWPCERALVRPRLFA